MNQEFRNIIAHVFFRESEMEKLMVQQKEMVKLVRGLSEQVEALAKEGRALKALITKRAPLAQAD